MNNETYEALKEIVEELEKSNETNDFSYFILNPNSTRANLVKLRNWIKAKEHTD